MGSKAKENLRTILHSIFSSLNIQFVSCVWKSYPSA